MNFRKVAAVVVMILFVLPMLIACGGGAPAPGTINVDEVTYGISLSSNTAPAGNVTFHVKNNATDQQHEFVVVQTDTPADKLPLDADGNVNEDLGEAEEIDPGTSKDLTLNLPPGHYVLMCNLPGHYAQGMHLDFTVQ